MHLHKFLYKTLKPPQGDIQATSKRVASQAVATPKPPSCVLKATLMRPSCVPHATYMRPTCAPPSPQPQFLSLNLGNIQHPTSNAQHPILAQTRGFGCSMFDVGCWVFLFFGSGVQGAKSRFLGVLSVARQGYAPFLRLSCLPETGLTYGDAYSIGHTALGFVAFG